MKRPVKAEAGVVDMTASTAGASAALAPTAVPARRLVVAEFAPDSPQGSFPGCAASKMDRKVDDFSVHVANRRAVSATRGSGGREPYGQRRSRGGNREGQAADVSVLRSSSSRAAIAPKYGIVITLIKIPPSGLSVGTGSSNSRA